jgi:hypothetical protein
MHALGEGGACLHLQQRGFAAAQCQECADIEAFRLRLTSYTECPPLDPRVEEEQRPLLRKVEAKLAERVAPYLRPLAQRLLELISEEIKLAETTELWDLANVLRAEVIGGLGDEGSCTYEFHWTEAIDEGGETCMHCGEPWGAHHVIRVCPREGCTPEHPYDVVGPNGEVVGPPAAGVDK